MLTHTNKLNTTILSGFNRFERNKNEHKNIGASKNKMRAYGVTYFSLCRLSWSMLCPGGGRLCARSSLQMVGIEEKEKRMKQI